MKRGLLLLVLACWMCVGIMAGKQELQIEGEEVYMSINPIKSGGLDNDPPRGPVEIPQVLIDSYTLYITGVSGDYVLQLETASGVAYSVPIQGSTGSDTVVLPSSLSGTYELCLYFASSGFRNYQYQLAFVAVKPEP